MNTKKVTLTVALTTSGLIVGLLFAFEVAIIPAFAKLSDSEYVRAMQIINNVIQNPVFILCFLAAPASLVLATYLYRSQSASRKFKLLLVATIVYLVGVVGVTAGGNIPLNNQLANLKLDTASAADITAARTKYEDPWNTLHTIRTVLGVVAVATLAVAAQEQARKEEA